MDTAVSGSARSRSADRRQLHRASRDRSGAEASPTRRRVPRSRAASPARRQSDDRCTRRSRPRWTSSKSTSRQETVTVDAQIVRAARSRTDALLLCRHAVVVDHPIQAGRHEPREHAHVELGARPRRACASIGRPTGGRLRSTTARARRSDWRAIRVRAGRVVRYCRCSGLSSRSLGVKRQPETHGGSDCRVEARRLGGEGSRSRR